MVASRLVALTIAIQLSGCCFGSWHPSEPAPSPELVALSPSSSAYPERVLPHVPGFPPDEEPTGRDFHRACFHRGPTPLAPDGDLRVRDIGPLIVSSGRIVAADCIGGGGSGFAPFADRIAPGSYPVEMCFIHEPNRTHPGAFVDEVVAVRAIFDASSTTIALEPTSPAAFGVDAGVGCFMAREAWDAFPDDDYRGVLDDLQARSPSHTDRAAGGGSLVVFSTNGDGVFQTFWTRNEGRIASLDAIVW